MQRRKLQLVTRAVGTLAGTALLSPVSARAATYTVTNTGDSGAGSLRQAILSANAVPGSTIKFALSNPVSPDGTRTIAPVTSLPAITAAGTIIDGTSQTTFGGDTNSLGPEIVLRGPGGSFAGFNITANGCTIKGFVIGRFTAGVYLHTATATQNKIQGCYLGVGPTGTASLSNSQGVLIGSGATSNTIGGTSAAQSNLISGNSDAGVQITGASTDSNSVLNNKIGTSADGLSAIPNHDGVRVEGGAKKNLIGSGLLTGGNLISGNAVNVKVQGTGTNSTSIVNNRIGLKANGQIGFGTQVYGVAILAGAQQTNVGAANSNLPVVLRNRNYIGGCNAGVYIAGLNTMFNNVDNNYIGVANDGLSPRANNYGVWIDAGAEDNDVFDVNVIGGNAVYGVFINGQQSNTPTAYNHVYANYIGIGADGVTAVPNGDGICLGGGAQNNEVGGFKGAPNNLFGSNLISGNVRTGVLLKDTGTSLNDVYGNFIGMDVNSAARPNGGAGIRVTTGAYSNNIGVLVPDSAASEVDCVPNGCIVTQQKDEGNEIAYNGGEGVLIDGNAFSNPIRGNVIHDNKSIGINLMPAGEAPGKITFNDSGDPDTGPNGVQNMPILTSVGTQGFGTSVQGKLNSNPNTKFEIDFYASDAADPSGYGEGKVYLGSVFQLTTDASGNLTFNFVADGSFSGKYISAVATSAAGNSSEFSKVVQSPLVKISVGDASATENTGATPGSMQFPVYLSRISSRIVKIHYQTVQGVPSGSTAPEATDGVDYVTTQGDLTINPGKTSGMITVPLLADNLKEQDEQFLLDISAPTYGVITDNEAVGTIIDDDNQKPAVVSLNPDVSTDAPLTNRTFTAVYSDGNGATDIANASFMVGAPPVPGSTANMLLCYYDRAANKLYVRDDAGSAYIGGYAPGSANVIANSYGKLNCQTTTVSPVGNDLTINWTVQSLASVAGVTLPLSLAVQDTVGVQDGYDTLGTWSITGNKAPSNVSIAPANATDAPDTWRTFTAVYSDPNTWRNLSTVVLKIGGTANVNANTMYCRYNVQTKQLDMMTDNGISWLPSQTLGVPGTLTNSQGTLDVGATSISASGNNLIVKWVVKASIAFQGTQNLALYCGDRGNLNDGFDDMGSWNVQAGAISSQVIRTGSSYNVF